jgi:hypothetical protein
MSRTFFVRIQANHLDEPLRNGDGSDDSDVG